MPRGRKRTASRRRSPSRRLRVEPLEQRTLLAVDYWPGTLIHDDTGDIFSVDLDGGMALEYVDTVAVLSDMAFSPEGKLYGVNLPWWGGPSSLFSFTTDFETPSIETDPEWPRLIERGDDEYVHVNSLGFNAAGELFAVGSKYSNPHYNPNFLFEIDPDTAEAEEILPLGDYRSAGDLTFDSHGNMYLTTVSGELLRIPPAQDSFEVVGQTGIGDFYGSSFGPAPFFYGFSWSEEVYQIDMATGESTLVTQFTDPWLDNVNGTATIFPAPTDLGEVDFRELTDQQPTLGEFWYRLEAVRDALLTVEVANVDPAAEIDVTLYEFDGEGNLVELETGLLRVDYEHPDAGGEYYVQIAGADSDFDLRVANLVQIHGVGNGALVHGTDENDTFAFVHGSPYLFTINGVDYSFNFSSGSVVVIRFEGGIGRDVAHVTGSHGRDTATLNLATFSGTVTRSPPQYRVELSGTHEMTFDGAGGNDSATLIGSGSADEIGLEPMSAAVVGLNSSLEVTHVETIDVDGGLGADSATFTGTINNETADLRYHEADFAGTGFSIGVTNVESISAVAGGGYDTATFADSTQQDTFQATPQWASLSGPPIGPGFSLTAHGYAQVRAESTHGGDDVALLRDNPGAQDWFVATPEYGRLTGSGFDNQATSFRYLHGYGTTGDEDVALLHGNPGAQDRFEAWPTVARLYGPGYYNRVKSFRYVHAYGTAGDEDVALLYGDPGAQDWFGAWPTVARLYGAGYYNRVNSFRYVHAYGNPGDNDVALLYGNPGAQDWFGAWPTMSRLYGAGYYNAVNSFRYVHAYSTTGDKDVALLHGDPGRKNFFQAWPTVAWLYGTGFYNRVNSFRYVHAYGTTSGMDVAYLYDNPTGVDLFSAWPQQSVLSGAGYYNRANSFAHVYAYATPGYNDVAKFYLGAGNNEVFEAWPDRAVLDGPGYHIKAWDFRRVEAYGNASDDDQALLHDAVLTTDYLEAIGDWAELSAGDDSFSFFVEDFDDVTAFSTTSTGDIKDVGTVTYTLILDGFWQDPP